MNTYCFNKHQISIFVSNFSIFIIIVTKNRDSKFFMWKASKSISAIKDSLLHAYKFNRQRIHRAYLVTNHAGMCNYRKSYAESVQRYCQNEEHSK
jgi:REP element-mobilizing transposase RayT